MSPPFLRNDAEAARHAAQFRPYENAFGPLDMAYARRYGVRAAEAAARCRLAALRGDTRALYLAQKALSTILYVEKPELFEQRQPRKVDATTTSPWPALSRPSLRSDPPSRVKSVQWTDLSDERREQERAATPSSGTKLDGPGSIATAYSTPAHGEKGRAA